ncbi:MAG TPA: hypothetical protein VHJ76_01875 [Actinomycetota bacterium]|nr:hypothetical protein [Actinomycetota bacterium]
MTSDEDRLEQALRSVGDDYLRRNPADLHEARTKVGRLRRRRPTFVRASCRSAGFLRR